MLKGERKQGKCCGGWTLDLKEKKTGNICITFFSWILKKRKQKIYALHFSSVADQSDPVWQSILLLLNKHVHQFELPFFV